MPLTMTTTAQNCPFFLILKDADGNLGAHLPFDTALAVTSDPPDLAVVSLDPNPLPISNPFDPHAGTRSIASGVIRSLAAGAVTVTASLQAGDGSELASLSDTLTLVEPAEGVAAWSGELFGASLPLVLPAAASEEAVESEEPEESASESPHRRPIPHRPAKKSGRR